MKKIVIYQEKSEPIVLLDNDDTEVEVYTKNFTKVLESSKVCMIEVTSSNVLIKPSKINSIVISELTDSNSKEQHIKKEKIQKNKNTEVDDIIKD